MREFFRGWRRKAGCVTLVMAFACFGGWIRNQTTLDVVGWDPELLQFSMSDCAFICWDEGGVVAGQEWEWPEYFSEKYTNDRTGFESNIDWFWRYLDFGFGEHGGSVFMTIPYWLIILLP